MLSSCKLGAKVVTRRVARFLSTKQLHPVQFLKFDTLVELQQKATAAYSSNPMFGTKVGGAFEWISFSEFDVEVGKCRIVLNEMKVGKNDKVALISNNRVEWAIIKYATVGVGGQIVPM